MISICTLGLPAWGTDLKSWKGSGPSHTVLILVRVLTTKLELFSVATKSRFQFLQVLFFKKKQKTKSLVLVLVLKIRPGSSPLLGP
jgi:hypothetical protein